MKIICLLIFLLFLDTLGNAQDLSLINYADSSGIPETKEINTADTTVVNKTAITLPVLSRYGYLLNDDPFYNKKPHLWVPVARTASVNIFNLVVNRYFFNEPWARLSYASWKKNIGHWWWDTDGFFTNFIGHPYTGSFYFNVARSNGYNFGQSTLFTAGGSLMWELFCENEPPSKNDIVYTSIGGIVIGEVLYRISSNILDDRKRRKGRMLREITAGLINNTRGLNRLTNGKMFRVLPNDVYQKEPLIFKGRLGINMTYGKLVRSDTANLTGLASLECEYGDPFEKRRRKPFDVFKAYMEVYPRPDKKNEFWLVTGYGLLSGKNINKGKLKMLAGIYQHFDYWTTRNFYMSSLGFGPGILSQFNISRNLKFNSAIHITGSPLNASNVYPGKDTIRNNRYALGGGFQGKTENTITLKGLAQLGITGYYFWNYSYENAGLKSRLGLIKPSFTINISRSVHIGSERSICYESRYTNKKIQVSRKVKQEQRFFVQVLFQSPKQKALL